jgi:hypothetical protein
LVKQKATHSDWRMAKPTHLVIAKVKLMEKHSETWTVRRMETLMD